MTKTRPADPVIDDRLDKLATGAAQPLSWDEVRDAVEQVLASVDGDVAGDELKLLAEIKSIARYISEIKLEIASIRPEAISEEHIRSATGELDQVVSATEAATDAIMSAAEMVERVAEAADPRFADVLGAAATRIYEACSFQDITGQRIGKVVDALKAIDTMINRLLETFGGEDCVPVRETGARQNAKGPNAPLQGPGKPGDANNQDDVDALLAGLD